MTQPTDPHSPPGAGAVPSHWPRVDGPDACASPSPRPPEPPQISAAGEELASLHRNDLVGLLLEASALRAQVAPFALLSGTPAALPSPPDWTGRALDTIDRLAKTRVAKRSRATRRSGPRPVDPEILLLLIGVDLHRWPASSWLARAALAAQDSNGARLCLGRALLAEGDTEDAHRVFVDLLRRGVTDELRWQVFEGIAFGHEQRGNDRLALVACEAAGDAPGCGIGPLVGCLFLSLVLGEAGRARRAAARLDLLVNPDSPAFARELAKLRLRVELFRGGLPWSAPPSTAALLDELAGGGRSAAEEVGRTLRGAPDPAPREG